MSTSRAFTVEILIKAKNAAAGPMKNFRKGFSDALTIPKTLNDAMNVLGRGLANVVNQLPQMAVEFVKLGASVQRQAGALDGLAESYGTTGDAIVGAMQDASGFTIDRMAAMQAANKAMILDVAKTPEAFGELAEVATVLGRAMGQDAAKSIDDFVVAAGRQSRMIADNLGLMVSAEDANKRYAASVGVTVDQLTDAQRKQAFLNEMLRQGKIKMAAMTDESGSLSTKIEVMTAAVADAKTGLAELAAQALSSGGDVDDLAARTRRIPEAIQEIGAVLGANKDAWDAFWSGRNAVDAWRTSIQQSKPVLDDILARHVRFQDDEENLRAALEETTVAIEEDDRTLRQWQLTLMSTSDVVAELRNDEVLLAQAAEDGARRRQAAIEVSNRALQQAQEFAFEASLSFMDFNKRTAESAEKFSEQREELEADHQEKLAELAKRGQARAIQINVAAEQEKLETMKQRLELALLRQSEFTEKTKESTRLAKENQIVTLQEQIATQEQLLTDFHAGRLFTSGENVTALVEQENLAHQERVADLEEAQLKQEEIQRQSLGRMMLQSFEQWAAMKDIPADKMLEMRIAISQEFGLIDQEAANKLGVMVKGWETWADAVGTEVGDANATMATIKEAIDAIPSVKEVQIRVSRILTGGGERGAGREEFEQRGGLGGLQFGTSFARGGTFLVGEREPEIITLPPGATATPVSSVTNFNMTVNTRADTASVRQDFEMMQGMAG